MSLLEPRQRGLLFSNLLLEPRSDLAQEPVSNNVSSGVVDRFEIVQIEVEESDVRPSRPALAKHGAQALVEQVAVREAGEIVVMRHDDNHTRIFCSTGQYRHDITLFRVQPIVMQGELLEINL